MSKRTAMVKCGKRLGIADARPAYCNRELGHRGGCWLSLMGTPTRTALPPRRKGGKRA